MVLSKHLVIAIFQGALIILPLLVQTHHLTGFISIDCGLSDGSEYIDEKTDIRYVSDTEFTESGENGNIAEEYTDDQTVEKQLSDMRSFPEGIRNCYTLKPKEEKGSRFLIRARFLYGNYDQRDAPPTFDLYIGVDLWDTIEISNAKTPTNTEIVHVLSSDHIQVCLVNTGNGIPFISVLELRPLEEDIYVSESGTSLLLYGRFDFSSATGQVMRYKDDIYARLWQPFVTDDWKPFISIPIKEDSMVKNEYKVPFPVMSSAYTLSQYDNDMSIQWNKTLNRTSSYYFYMHFAELEKLQINQSREFSIDINEKSFGSVVPEYLIEYTVCTRTGITPNSEGKIQIWLNKTKNSTLPPLINAIEIYVLKNLSGVETNQIDFKAISNVKSMYGLKKNWQGDPCSPEAHMWDGLNCSYNVNNPPRIVSLNLSSSGLKGDISPSIANLEMLQCLDLSNNSLSGTVPEFLAQLSFLKIINIKDNKFSGPIPPALIERSNNGLSFSIDTNLSPPNPHCSSGSCGGGKKSFVAPLVASLGGVLFFVFLTVAAVLWTLRKRRKQRKATDMKVDTAESYDNDRSFVSKKQRFKHSEIQRITNKFKRVLGEGGFGKVYHGYLNGVEVAVKMLSPSSFQGHRQFHAELKLLLRVHHKNLTTLVGYCNDGTNIGLIYEYMAMGNLRSHLFGNDNPILSWEDRLKIAVDTAQGLEYLHNGCKPPIVHRDVKTTNILLNEKFQAKLSDFGLSKIFPCEGDRLASSSTNPGFSTSVAGTLGYLDPEYYLSNWLNEKSDVYSFGVVLLEMIAARPVFIKTGENNHITDWVSSMLVNGDVKKIIDPKLEGSNLDINSVWRAIEIAMACVSKTSTNRPTMSRVTVELKECLTMELTRKDVHDKAESEDFDEVMFPNVMFSEQSLPLAR